MENYSFDQFMKRAEARAADFERFEAKIHDLSVDFATLQVDIFLEKRKRENV